MFLFIFVSTRLAVACSQSHTDSLGNVSAICVDRFNTTNTNSSAETAMYVLCQVPWLWYVMLSASVCFSNFSVFEMTSAGLLSGNSMRLCSSYAGSYMALMHDYYFVGVFRLRESVYKRHVVPNTVNQ